MGHGRGTRAQGNEPERQYITASFRDIDIKFRYHILRIVEFGFEIQDGYLVNQLLRTLLHHILLLGSTKFLLDLRGALVEQFGLILASFRRSRNQV